jgi:hypothetical protein
MSQPESDTCLVAAVAYLIPDLTTGDRRNLSLHTEKTADYQAWLGKCNTVAAKHHMEFLPVKPSVKPGVAPRGKLLLFGRLNHRLFDCLADGDWSHCVAVDTAENYMACCNLVDPDPENHQAYGPGGWLSAYDYLAAGYATYRLVPLSPVPPRKRRRLDTSVKFAYNAASISTRNSKKHANELFTASLDRVCKKLAPGLVMYLEGQDGNTSRYISPAVKRRHTTLVVNCDPSVVTSLVARDTGASLLASTVQEWSRRVMEASVVGCWLDYCATLHGNAACSPFADICNLVFRRAFRPGGMVAMTLSTRDPVTSSPASELPGKILQMFIGNYHAATLQDVYSYHGMIYFSIQL